MLADLVPLMRWQEREETAETILDQLLDMSRQSYVPAICLARVYQPSGRAGKDNSVARDGIQERNGELVFLENEIPSCQGIP